MKAIIGSFLLYAAIILLLVQPVCAASASFSNYSLDVAKERAKQGGKLLLIDFTASWCGPCHRMDKESWSDPAVQKWVAENAVAIQLDVDKEKSLSESFKIAAMPSVVAFSQSDQAKEFDRHVGYLSAKDLLNWLAAMKKGETWVDVLGHEVERLAGKGGDEELAARKKYGRALLEKAEYGKAAPQYVALWQSLPKDPPEKAMRLPALAGEIVLLVSKDAAARERFQQLRDESESTSPLDFVILNEILSEPNKSLDWFDKIKTQTDKQADLKQVDFLLEKLLLRNDRWADLCVLYPDPVAELNERSKSADKFMEIMSKQGRKTPDPLPKDIAALYASLLAAGRDSEARKFAAECLKVRKTDEMNKQLVKAALAAKQPRKEQRKWAEGDSELMAKLDESLKVTGKK